MMTLITDMGNLDLLLLQMLRHDNRLDNLPWSGLNGPVVAAQAQHLDFFFLFNRQLSIDLARLDVIRIGTVAEFT